MKVLVVASFNKGWFAPFIVEQVETLQKEGCAAEWFGLRGKGIKGYLHNLSSLKKKIEAFCPDVVHAHYGLSGLLANLQRRTVDVECFCFQENVGNRETQKEIRTFALWH